jgi:short-subunit dehydrogenase
MTRRQIKDRRILITGASSGIGAALARELGRHHARLVLTARRADRLETLAAELRGYASKVICVPGDITRAEHRAQLIDQGVDAWGGIDILINNAGVGAIGKFADADTDRLRKVMEVNFFAPVELIRQALPALRQGNQPLIVNIGSVLGHRAVPRKSEYCAAKFAMHGFSDSLRAELAEQGINVLLVNPSTTTSEFFSNVIAGGNGQKPRGMTPESVAKKTIRAMTTNKQEIILSAGGKLLVWIDRLLPNLANYLVAKFG